MKKYNGTEWVDTTLRQYKTATDTFTTLPADIYADGNNATVGISGNTVQNGTPTPDNPIMPQGTGERTGNLFSSVWEQGSVNATTGQNEVSGTLVRTKDYISIKPNIPYSFSRDIFNGYTNVRLYRADKSYISPGSASTIRLISGSTTANPMGTDNPFCCFEVIDSEAAYIRFNDSSNNAAIKWLMVEGEYTRQTMPEYEPYGYKIPISSASTTTPVYLGEVETTRRVKKLVLTGDEDWRNSTSDNTKFFIFSISPDYLRSAAQITYICTHYIPYQQTTDALLVPNGRISMSSATAQRLYIADNNYTTVEDFKTYLAQQYANGTPVTVWYVLATPQTAAVNEPLMKIGDYTDTLSNAAQIPTSEGANSITVDTAVQPSEFTATWTGWHDSSVKEWDGSDWQ